jgi:hypothetical protein
MTIIYSDNFDSDTTGANAPGWTAGSGTWAVGTQFPVSGTKSLSCSTTTNQQVNVYTANGYAQADQSASVDFVYSTLATRTRPGPMVRIPSSAGTSGYVVLFGYGGFETSIVIYKVVNGTNTMLANGAHSVGSLVADSTKITMEIRAVGNTIEARAYVSGGTRPATPNISATDSTFAAGAPGIFSVYAASAAFGGFDNFVFTDGIASSAATALTLSASSTGVVGTGNTVTVGVDGSISASVTANLTATNGTFSPTSVTLTTGTPSATSTYTPASAGVKTLTATDAAAALTTATASQTVSATAATFDESKVLFSPGNWNVGTSNAKTIYNGAYFKTTFAGTSMALSFDMTGVGSPVPKVTYRVDGLNWVTVDLAATINVTMPSETAALTTHSFEFYVGQTTTAVNLWSPQGAAVVLTGITLSTGGLTLPSSRALKGLWFGDSIPCGVGTFAGPGVDATLRGRQQLSYPYLVSELLGVEFGVVAFGGQGWQQATGSNGSVPAFTSTYNLLWSGGPTRSFAGLDYIIINHGQNDAAVSTVTQVTTVLNALIAGTDRRTKLIVLEPLSGLQNSNLIAGIAATTAPGRITYINTFTGVSPVWFNSANSADGVHPYAFEHRNSITPKAVAALRPYLQPIKGAVSAQTARTVTLTLVDATGTARSNLTGIKWSIFDQSTPDGQRVAVDQGTGATTDSSGVLTLSVFTTLAAGQNVWLTLSNSDGTTTQSPAAMAFAGPAVLS